MLVTFLEGLSIEERKQNFVKIAALEMKGKHLENRVLVIIRIFLDIVF